MKLNEAIRVLFVYALVFSLNLNINSSFFSKIYKKYILTNSQKINLSERLFKACFDSDSDLCKLLIEKGAGSCG